MSASLLAQQVFQPAPDPVSLAPSAPGTQGGWDRIEAAVEILARALGVTTIPVTPGPAAGEIGVYNTAFPTLTDGESTQAQTNVNGVLYVIPSNPVGAANLAVTNLTANNSGTTTLASRATRRNVVLICPPTSAEAVYFRQTTGPSATTGAPMAPGSSISLDITGPLFFFSTAGTGTVSCTEIYD